MRPFAVVWYDIDLAQMDRAAKVQGALLRDLLVSRQDSAQQFEHGLDGADSGHPGGLRIVESQEITITGAPHASQPAAPADLTDQGSKITKRMATDGVPPEQVAGECRFNEINYNDRFGDDLRQLFGIARGHCWTLYSPRSFRRRNSTSPTPLNERDSLAPARVRESLGIRSSA